jgi:hypothetical protein
MEIKDLAGLSKPLTRLIEVSSAGLGRLTEAHFKKKMADAKAYEIRIVTEALRETNTDFEKLSYDKKGLLAVCEKQGVDQEKVDATIQLMERSGLRVAEQEARRQKNIESVLSGAAEHLSKESAVPNDKPNDDWTTRFFRYSEDIGSEEMQGLWSKILAGEILKPNTYSLRFLDAIRNISTVEAEIFCRLANFALEGGDKIFVLSEQKFLDGNSLTFSDLLILRDIGLIYPNDLRFRFLQSKKGTQSHLIYAGNIVLIDREEDTPEIPLQSIIFTKIGSEILSLVQRTVSEQYLSILASKLKAHNGVSVTHARILSILGDQIQYGPKVQL